MDKFVLYKLNREALKFIVEGGVLTSDVEEAKTFRTRFKARNYISLHNLKDFGIVQYGEISSS